MAKPGLNHVTTYGEVGFAMVLNLFLLTKGFHGEKINPDRLIMTS